MMFSSYHIHLKSPLFRDCVTITVCFQLILILVLQNCLRNNTQQLHFVFSNYSAYPLLQLQNQPSYNQKLYYLSLMYDSRKTFPTETVLYPMTFSLKPMLQQSAFFSPYASLHRFLYGAMGRFPQPVFFLRAINSIKKRSDKYAKQLFKHR